MCCETIAALNGQLVSAARILEDEIWSLLSRTLGGRCFLLVVRAWDVRARALAAEIAAAGGTVGAVISGQRTRSADSSLPYPIRAADPHNDLSKSDLDHWLNAPPAEFLDWLEALDPRRTWLIVAPPGTQGPTIARRELMGFAPAEAARLEDKTKIEPVFAALSIASAPNEIVLPTHAHLLAAMKRVDAGLGVVVSRDSTLGHMGDSMGLRWARSAEEMAEVARWLNGQSLRARVSTFRLGVPCSVLGMVFNHDIAIFDPIEIVTLVNDGRLTFFGSSTHWSPAPPVREEIRHAARTMGAHLAARYNYRGIFCLDGLATTDGFIATEMNPRHASGLGVRKAMPRLPLDMFNRILQAGYVPADAVDAATVERILRAFIGTCPSFSVRLPRGVAPEGQREVILRLGGSEFRTRVAVERDAVHLLEIDPLPEGGCVAPLVGALAQNLGLGDYRSYEQLADSTRDLKSGFLD